MAAAGPVPSATYFAAHLHGMRSLQKIQCNRLPEMTQSLWQRNIQQYQKEPMLAAPERKYSKIANPALVERPILSTSCTTSTSGQCESNSQPDLKKKLIVVMVGLPARG